MTKGKTRSTEPKPVPDLFVTAVSLDSTGEYVRLTGWVAHTASLAPETKVAERRIVARLVMPQSTARDLLTGLQRQLRRGDTH